MSTPFTQIIQRQLPAHIIAEDQDHIAFLDIDPKRTGHTLVVLKEEVDYFFHLSTQQIEKMIGFAQPIAHALERAIPCERIALLVFGQEIAHVHLHLIPVQPNDDLMKKNKTTTTDVELNTVAQKIRLQLENS